MIHKTKGIILRSVKYGETSVIVTILTELFGLQSYLVNGVRTSKGKSGSQVALFQPAALLDLVIYHQESKSAAAQRIQLESFIQTYFSDVVTNSIALFMIELLQKCLKQPEPNPELYYFMEDALTGLDESEPNVQANFSLSLPCTWPAFSDCVSTTTIQKKKLSGSGRRIFLLKKSRCIHIISKIP